MTRVLVEQSTDGCNSRQKNTINANLMVPAIPPTDCSTSKIIKVRYAIRVRKNHFLFMSRSLNFIASNFYR